MLLPCFHAVLVRSSFGFIACNSFQLYSFTGASGLVRWTYSYVASSVSPHCGHCSTRGFDKKLWQQNRHDSFAYPMLSWCIAPSFLMGSCMTFSRCEEDFAGAATSRGWLISGSRKLFCFYFTIMKLAFCTSIIQTCFWHFQSKKEPYGDYTFLKR